jgi:hypothetical protein
MLLTALGPVGEYANSHGHVSIQRVADLFRVSHPDAACQPSLVELMHRCDRDEILNVVNPTLYQSGSPTRGSLVSFEQVKGGEGARREMPFGGGGGGGEGSPNHNPIDS